MVVLVVEPLTIIKVAVAAALEVQAAMGTRRLVVQEDLETLLP
jgi:hypothetical protein